MSKESQTARIVRLLKSKYPDGSYRWVPFTDLNRICFRYGARLHELRHEEGYDIEKRIRNGVWEYRYTGNLDEAVAYAD